MSTGQTGGRETSVKGRSGGGRASYLRDKDKRLASEIGRRLFRLTLRATVLCTLAASVFLTFHIYKKRPLT